MQNLRHPQRGSADLGDRKSPYQYGEFRRNSTDYRLISKISESGTFFLSSTGFFDLVKCDSPFFLYRNSRSTNTGQ